MRRLTAMQERKRALLLDSARHRQRLVAGVEQLLHAPAPMASHDWQSAARSLAPLAGAMAARFVTSRGLSRASAGLCVARQLWRIWTTRRKG